MPETPASARRTALWFVRLPPDAGADVSGHKGKLGKPVEPAV